MKKELREQVYKKYNGHCAYCGREIAYKNMQVDHIIPKWHTWSEQEIAMYNKHKELLGLEERIKGTDDISNLLPACRRCNFKKSTLSIDRFRQIIKHTINTLNDEPAYLVAKDFGLIKETESEVKFYFEVTNA